MANRDRMVGGNAETVSSQTNDQRLEGKVVSLNFPRRALFALDGVDFVLNYRQPSGRIPDYLTPMQRDQILAAIRRRELLVTDKPVYKPAKQPKAFDTQIAILTASGMGMDAIKSMINGVVRMSDSDPKLGGHTRFEALEILFKTETDGYCRRDVLEYLTAAMEYVPGPTSVKDEPGAIRTTGRTAATAQPPKVGQDPSAAELGEI